MTRYFPPTTQCRKHLSRLRLALVAAVIGSVLVASPHVEAARAVFQLRTTADGLGDIHTNDVRVSGGVVYVATRGGLGISTDGGTTFTNKTTLNGLGSNDARAVFIVGSAVYVATMGGLSISSDGGTTFSNKTTANGLGSNSTYDVFVTGSTVYVATGGGLSISTNSGSSFTNKTTADGLGSNVINRVSKIGSRLYASTQYGLSISDDAGATFVNRVFTVGLSLDTYTYGVQVVGTNVYVCTGLGVGISTDGGNTFEFHSYESGFLSRFEYNVIVDNRVLYVASASGFAISTNGGQSFTNVGAPEFGLATNPMTEVEISGSTIFVTSNAGLLIASNQSAASPNVTAFPVSQTTEVGQSVTFNSSATSSDSGVVSYEWQKDGQFIPGATSSSYVIPSVTSQDAGQYRAVVTNLLFPFSSSVITATATLTVNTPVVTTTTLPSVTTSTVQVNNSVPSTNPQTTTTTTTLASGTSPSTTTTVVTNSSVKRIVVTRAPSARMAQSVEIYVEGRAITIGIKSPNIVKTSTQSVMNYFFSLQPTSKQATVISKVIAVYPNRAYKPVLRGVMGSTYAIRITAKTRAGKYVTWNGPFVRIT